LLTLAACQADQTALAPAESSLIEGSASLVDGGPNYVPGEVLVKFKRGATPALRGRAMQVAAAEAKERIVTAAMRSAGDDEGVTVLRTGMAVPRAIEALLASGAVEYAEPNWIYTHDAVSNDPYVTNGSLWGMYGNTSTPANQFGSGAAIAWKNGATDCSSVYIGIIDEGYMYTHEDLTANAGVNPGEVANNGIDDDKNGYIDDVYGWDFVGGNNSVYDGTNDDHGTHVAGTIGAVGGNGKGVAGICWSVKLMGGKFLGSSGGSTANAIKAVDYFTDLKTRHGINLVATSNSWGGGGYSTSLFNAIERAKNADILFIAAAGNSSLNCEINSCYPASYANANVIAVASITSSGAMSSFSNYGSTTIDIGAPGSSVLSTLPGSGGTSTYGTYSGTSMATPHVSGAAALYWSLKPQASAAEIKAAIMSSTIPTTSLSGVTVSGGRLNVSSFTSSLNSPPIAKFSPNCLLLTCTFDGSASSDPDGSIAGYAWTFGDGTEGTGVSVTKSYAVSGNFSVKLTVTDDKGAQGTSTAIVSVTVPPIPPTILSVTGASSRNGTKSATIVWSGNSAAYDVYRNGTKRASARTGTSYVDGLGKYSGSRNYQYKVCVAGSTTSCSADYPFSW
jgi:subtilisin family serine protease